MKTKNKKFDRCPKSHSAAETMRTFLDPKVLRDKLFLDHDVDIGMCPAKFNAGLLDQSDEIAMRIILQLPPEMGRAYHVAVQIAMQEAEAAGRFPYLYLHHVKRALDRVGHEGFKRREPDLLENTSKWLWLWITDAILGDEPAPEGRPREGLRELWEPPYETYREYWARLEG